MRTQASSGHGRGWSKAPAGRAAECRWSDRCSRRRSRRCPGSDVPYRLIVVLEGVRRSMPVAFEASPTGPARGSSPTTEVGNDAGTPPSILLIHERYRQRAGEDAVFDAELALLRRMDHDVTTLVVDNDAIPDEPSVAQRARLAVDTVWSSRAARLVSERIAARPVDIVHAHNTFPLLSPSIYGAARRSGRPWCRRSTTIERCARQRPSFATDGLARTASDGPCLGRRCCTPATAGRGSRPSRWPPWWPPMACGPGGGCRYVHRPDGFRRRQAG